MQQILQVLPPCSRQRTLLSALLDLTSMPYEIIYIIEEYDRSENAINECIRSTFDLLGMKQQEKKEYSALSKQQRWHILRDTVYPLPLRCDSSLFSSYIDGHSSYSLDSVNKRMRFMSWLHRETNYGSLLGQRSSQIYMRREMRREYRMYEDRYDRDYDSYDSDSDSDYYEDDDSLRMRAISSFLSKYRRTSRTIPSEYELLTRILHPDPSAFSSYHVATIAEPSPPRPLIEQAKEEEKKKEKMELEVSQKMPQEERKDQETNKKEENDEEDEEKKKKSKKVTAKRKKPSAKTAKKKSKKKGDDDEEYLPPASYFRNLKKVRVG